MEEVNVLRRGEGDLTSPIGKVTKERSANREEDGGRRHLRTDGGFNQFSCVEDDVVYFTGRVYIYI